MSAIISSESETVEILSINTPLDNSENALSPLFVWPHNNSELLVWNRTTAGKWFNPALQFGLLDTETHALKLTKQPIHYDDIIAEANRQELEYQRGRPIPGLHVPNPADCDSWEEAYNRQIEDSPAGLLRPDGRIQPVEFVPDRTSSY